MHILLAENLEQNGPAVRSILAEAGHSVTRACSCADALGILAQGAFPVVVIHERSPQWDGLDFCRQIKAWQGGAYIYTLLLAEPGQDVDDTSVDDIQAYPSDAVTLLESLQFAERWLTRDDRRSSLPDRFHASFPYSISCAS